MPVLNSDGRKETPGKEAHGVMSNSGDDTLVVSPGWAVRGHRPVGVSPRTANHRRRNKNQGDQQPLWWGKTAHFPLVMEMGRGD